MSAEIELARKMAVEAHGDQMYGDEPYVVHLDEVAALCERPEDKLIAYLHDTLEDTDLPREMVAAVFGETVAQCVEALTDSDGPTRKERKRLTYQRLSQIDPSGPLSPALVVKAADRLANVRRSSKGSPGLFLMYAKENEAFRSAVFRPGLNDKLVEEIDQLLEGK